MNRILIATLAASIAQLRIPQAVCQAPSSQEPPTSIFTTQTSLVIVPALVRTRTGDLLYTLTADDFVLTDDGIPQKLTLEQDTGGEPLAMVVVVEVGGAGARQFDKIGSLAPMLESLAGNVPYKVAVVAFDSQPTLVQGFTTHINEASDAITALTPGCSRQHHMENCAWPGSVHDLSSADNGAAILDSVGFAVDLLRNQPSGYRREILLVSETLDRGSHLTLEQAVRAVSDTNTGIYSIGFSTGKSEAAHYASRELPTDPQGSWLSLENPNPNPPHGCMGKDPRPDSDATHNKLVQAYDCLTQLAPPLALAKMAAIAAADAMLRNVPETVAQLTGGEYFKLTGKKSLESSMVTIANHLPNRYMLSFHPQSPHAGLHIIALRVPGYANLNVTARSSYWANPEVTQVNPVSTPQ